jgi:hypothetical protein
MAVSTDAAVGALPFVAMVTISDGGAESRLQEAQGVQGGTQHRRYDGQRVANILLDFCRRKKSPGG